MKWVAEVLAGLVALAGCCAVTGGGSGVFFSVQDIPCQVVVERVGKALEGLQASVSPDNELTGAQGSGWVVRGSQWRASVVVECLSPGGSKVSVITSENSPQAAEAVKAIAERLEKALAGRAGQ